MLSKEEGDLDVGFWVKRLEFILMHLEAVTVGKTGKTERRVPTIQVNWAPINLLL